MLLTMHWLLTGLLVLSAWSTAAHAQAPEGEAPTSQVSEGEAPEEGSAFSATVLGEVSVGAGTFTPGPAARPYVNLLTKVSASYTFEAPGLVLSGSLSVNVNAVENVDSGGTVPHQVMLSDLKLSLETDGLLAFGPVEITPELGLSLPTSLNSWHVGKIAGLKLGKTTTWSPLAWLDLDLRASLTKNFNLYTNAVLDADNFDIAPLSRAGGAEDLAEGRVATGGGVTSWFAVWGMGVTFTALEALTFWIDFEMLHLFSYDAIPLDAYSSPYAHEGRGQSDLMYGTIEVAYEVIEGLTLALGTMVEQTPMSDDNSAHRFPWWDTTNGSANRQVFYLDVIGSF